MTSLVQSAFVSRFVYNSVSLSKITEITAMLPTKGRTIRKRIGSGVRGGGLAKCKKNILAQGKIKFKKIHACQLILKDIHAMA